MAEESRQTRTDLNNTPGTKAARVVALQVSLVCFLFGVSQAAQRPAGNQARVAMVYPSELSLPLWGGAAATINTSLPDTLSADKTKLHHFDHIPCGGCHEAPVTNGDSAVAGNNGWKKGVDVNRSCTSFGCHQYDEKMNHPLDVSLPAGVSETMPDHSPVVTCLSCHQPQEPDSTDTLDGDTGLLLQSPEQVSCQSCHEKLTGTPRQRSHWKFSQTAHLVSLVPGPLNDGARDDFITSGSIDSESTACLSCHDEVTVTIPAMNETPQEKAVRFRSMTDHPIGMNYQYILSQNSMYFNSLADQQDRIRLFDGRVGCGSCHSLYSDISSCLTVEYKDSVLCHTCHNR